MILIENLVEVGVMFECARDRVQHIIEKDKPPMGLCNMLIDNGLYDDCITKDASDEVKELIGKYLFMYKPDNLLETYPHPFWWSRNERGNLQRVLYCNKVIEEINKDIKSLTVMS